MACRLCVIYVKEDNVSNAKATITRLIWTLWTSLSAVPRKAAKFNLSLTSRSFQPWLCNKTVKIWHILLCLLYSMYSSGWILSIFGTNDHEHKRVLLVQWPLTLTCIFMVIQLWLCSKTAKIWHILPCPLYSMYSFGWILSLFWHKWSLAWEGVLIGQWSRSHWLFEFLQSGGGYPSRSLIYYFSSSFPLGTRNLFPEN